MPVRRWLVSGRVQGVGFRWFVARRAEELALDGVARNLPDGRVEVVASGPEGALDALERSLAEGPRMARVERVDRSGTPPEDVGHKGFRTS